MEPCRQVLYACLNNLLNKQAENANKSGFMEGQQFFFCSVLLKDISGARMKMQWNNLRSLYLIYRDILLSVIKTALNLLNTRWQPA